jgi:isopentenyl diphosphate isomerase/L-lactate dehydrogenase-like FMN-dependent dehydrogenase
VAAGIVKRAENAGCTAIVLTVDSPGARNNETPKRAMQEDNRQCDACRGTDIFKALALGATAVGIGRPQVWGLAAFGQPGVEAVIDILNRELTSIMRQAGTPTIASITHEHLLHAPYFRVVTGSAATDMIAPTIGPNSPPK